jgi:hypothetical protein
MRYRLKKHRIGEVDEMREAGLTDLDEATELGDFEDLDQPIDFSRK